MTNPLDSTSKLIEIDYVTQEQAGMSAIMRDVAWIEKNICTIEGTSKHTKRFKIDVTYVN